MARYRRAVVIELNADDDLHVTIEGEHTVNDITTWRLALAAMLERSKTLHAAMEALDVKFETH